jgi:glycosyltransferase involved in cell wall biosynthesis
VRVDFAYSSRRDSVRLWELVEQVRQHGGEAVDLRVGNKPEAGDFRAAREIMGLVRRHDPQLVHAHSSKAGALCRMLRIVWRMFPPVIYTPNAYYGVGRKTTPWSIFFNLLEEVLGQRGTTINVSSDEREFARSRLNLPENRLVLIDNGVDIARFRPPAPGEREKGRALFSLPAGATVFIAVGRDSFQKNYRPLYRAMNRLLTDPEHDLHFVHAGAGAEELGRRLDPMARRRFQAHTHLDGIERLLRAGDAFILTSRYEGLALSALQALACGLKVFLTRVTGNASLSRIGFREISWIELTSDEEEMSRRIEVTLRAWLRDQKPATSAQVELAQSRVNAEIQFEKTWDLYNRLLAETPAV